jgi:hypothetical protein
MFKAVFLIALAFGVASAQRWPMITVNAAGEIVLQSLTRAQSFQITPAAITTAPSTSGTSGAANAALLATGVSAYVVTTNTSPLVPGHGVTLPTPSVGAQVTLFQSQTSFVSYTIWTSSSSVFVNDDSVSVSIPAYTRRVVCTCISTTRWNCNQDFADKRNVIATSASRTLVAAESGSLILASTTTTAITITLPSCSTATLGMYFDIEGIAGAASSIFHVKFATDTFVATAINSATVAAPPTTQLLPSGAAHTTLVITSQTTGAAYTTAATGVQTVKATCTASGKWTATVINTGVAPTSA